MAVSNQHEVATHVCLSMLTPAAAPEGAAPATGAAGAAGAAGAGAAGAGAGCTGAGATCVRRELICTHMTATFFFGCTSSQMETAMLSLWCFP